MQFATPFTAIANYLAPLTLCGALLAFFYPPAFLWLKGQPLLWLFAATMFCLGLVLQNDELRQTLTHPVKIALGVLTQYTVMPLLGFTVGILANLSPELALGFILVGCAPGAMASNVIVYLAGGAVAYSVSLTVVATLLAPLLTPLLVQQLGGAYLPVDFVAMMKNIFYTVALPLLLGMAIRPLLGATLARARQVAPAVAALAIVFICSYVVAANQERLANLAAWIFALVIVMNGLGYLFGSVLARLYGFNAAYRLTLSIEIGMQNAGMGVVLAVTHFADRPGVALPAALFAFWSVLSAAAATSYFRIRHKRADSATAKQSA